MPVIDAAVENEILAEFRSIVNLLPLIRASYTKELQERWDTRPDRRSQLEFALKHVDEEEARIGRLYRSRQDFR